MLWWQYAANKRSRKLLYMNTKKNSIPRISACLIVKNEEAMLPDCLRSLADITDEIVVVDTGSTDNTRTLAREFGCTVVETEWQNDFAKARNTALQHATGAWILSIDADERVLTRNALRRTVENANTDIGGYLVDVVSPTLRSDGNTDTFSTSMVRLFRNDEHIRFAGAIHEQIASSITAKGYTIARSALRFIHHGYTLPYEEMHQKHKRNLNLLHKALIATPTDGYLHVQRGKTLLALDQLQAAQRDFEVVVHGNTDATPLARAQASNYLAVLAYQADAYEQALQHVRLSLELLPHQAFANYIGGECSTAMKRFDTALEFYLYMQHYIQQNDAMAAIAGDYWLPPAQVFFRLGRCYTALKQWGKAEGEFRKGLEEDTNDLGCLVGCAEIALRSNRAQEALTLLQKAHSLAPEQEDIRRFLAIAESHNAAENRASAVDKTAPIISVTISGAMIVGDRTEGLEQALTSLQQLCDEIIVVHTGSSPLIPTIAQKFTSHIIPHVWQHDFSDARNAALQHCQGDWILMLDSDESFTQETADVIRLAIQTAQAHTGGFLTTIQHLTGGQTSATQILRLFRNHPTIRYEGFVHEQVTSLLSQAGFAIEERTDIILHHHPQPMSAAKQKQYAALLAKEVDRLGDTTEWAAFQYALLLFTWSNDIDIVESLQALDHYIQHPLMRRDNAAVLLNSYARYLLEAKQWNTLAGIAEDSLAYYPHQREGWWYSFIGHAHLHNPTHVLHSFRTLCSMYSPSSVYHTALSFEKTPSVQAIYSEGAQAAERLHNPDLREMAVSFARQHDIPVEQTPQRQEQPFNHGTQQLATDMQRPLLTVNMIVKNEEKFLPECLESLRGIADEIVITDTGSTDTTVAIAEACKARVLHTPWEGDFAKARNVSLQHSTGQWVLYIDADERLDPTQASYIRTMLQEAPETIGAFLCNIISPHRQSDNSTETHVGAYPRLFRNLGYPIVQFQGRVHEQISPSILNAGKNIAASDIVIHHLGYEQSLDVMRQKVRRNFELLMQHIQEEPTNGQAWLQLGFTLAFMNKNEEAEGALKFALQLGNISAHLEASAASTLAQMAGSSRKFNEALQWAEHALAKAPQQVYALHLRAHALLYLGRFNEAERDFAEVLRRLDNPGSSQAAYDVALDRAIIVQGLEKARARKL